MQTTPPPPMTIFILEDNADRTAVMDRLLADKFPFYRRKFARSAGEAITWLTEHWQSVVAVSLDHDLEPSDTDQSGCDPGTGRDVSDFLSGRKADFPVLVHTSNCSAAVAMEADLLDAKWSVSRVMPFDDLQWLAAAWLPLLRNVIVQSAAHNGRTAVPASAAGMDHAI